MKKTYFKPETVMVDVVLCNMIAISGPGYEGGTGDDFNANKHRGEWGNLWSK